MPTQPHHLHCRPSYLPCAALPCNLIPARLDIPGPSIPRSPREAMTHPDDAYTHYGSSLSTQPYLSPSRSLSASLSLPPSPHCERSVNTTTPLLTLLLLPPSPLKVSAAGSEVETLTLYFFFLRAFLRARSLAACSSLFFSTASISAMRLARSSSTASFFFLLAATFSAAWVRGLRAWVCRSGRRGRGGQ